jgi:hypothetical protein
MEQLSRDLLVKALKRAKFEGQANPTRDDITVPADVAADLHELKFLSQFSAVRELHELQRAKG